MPDMSANISLRMMLKFDIQAIKYECGSDLYWLMLHPGDWHLLRIYLFYLMTPFFEAVASSYPPLSVQSYSKFKKTHYFLKEIMGELILTYVSELSIIAPKCKLYY